VAAGRTSIDIHYHWPDGPIIGRLYVVVRALRTVNVRIHLVTVNGVGQAASFLGRTATGTETAAQLLTNRTTEIINATNMVLEPHGILLNPAETINTAWTNPLFGAAALPTTTRVMRAMALSPNRSATRVNLYLVNGGALPFAIPFVALGPPITWAIATSRRWPNNATGRVGSGIVVDTTAVPFTGSILAHEFGHVFALCSLVTAGVNMGTALQWHTIGDQQATPGPGHGPPSRDDIVTRRRLMYPFTSLLGSNNAWRTDVGYGNNMGAFLSQRRLTQDITFDESDRAYVSVGTAANIYAL
jgi:hypothetical protein